MTAKKTPAYHWSLKLVKELNNPECKLEEDDRIAVIRDKYPKARFHYLVLSKKDISSIYKLTKDDLELLGYMEQVAKKFADKHKGYEFQIGYHALPSMQRLHLHVISRDFDSVCLKTKTHWNSFTTAAFIPAEDIRKQLEENGCIKINREECEEYLKTELKCHRCKERQKNMPSLKRHILEHISIENEQ